MAESLYRNKHRRRRHKSPVERERRYATQRRRLVALGMTEDQARKLNPPELRALLRHPKKTAAKLQS